MKLKIIKEYLRDMPSFLLFHARERIRTLLYHDKKFGEEIRTTYEIGGRIILTDIKYNKKDQA